MNIVSRTGEAGEPAARSNSLTPPIGSVPEGRQSGSFTLNRYHNRMKNRKLSGRAGWTAGLLALGIALMPQAAWATGVSAGTLIENTATATYTSGSASGTVQSNTVTVKVDELLDVAVAGLTSTPAVAGSGNVVLAWSVTNTGNGPEAYNITVNPAVAGNNFDATVQSVVIDSNGNGTYDPGVDQVLTAGSPTPDIAADSSLKVFVIVSLPSGATDGQTSQVQLTATAVTGSGAPGTPFAGQGQGRR